MLTAFQSKKKFGKEKQATVSFLIPRDFFADHVFIFWKVKLIVVNGQFGLHFWQVAHCHFQCFFPTCFHEEYVICLRQPILENKCVQYPNNRFPEGTYVKTRTNMAHENIESETLVFLYRTKQNVSFTKDAWRTIQSVSFLEPSKYFSVILSTVMSYHGKVVGIDYCKSGTRIVLIETWVATKGSTICGGKVSY